ncbi:MAG: peptidylprolyl isomerase [Pirellulales bacterium]
MFARIGSKVALVVALACLSGCSKESPSETAAGGTSAGGVTSATTQTSAGSAASATARAPLPQLPDPIITMHTNLGDVLIRLNQKAAPRTVSNFVDYVLTKHYDGTIIHQIDAGYVLLGGSYTDKLVQKPVRYPIPNESNNGLKNLRGTISMARNAGEPNSATSQFFLNLADNPKLDRRSDKPDEAGYCVFGEVIQGLDVLDKIAQVRTASVSGFDKLPVQTVLVQSVSVVR